MLEAGRKKKIWIVTVAWLLVAAGMLLAPAPREWGIFGRWISPHYDRVQFVFQPAVHVVLMAVLSGLLMQHFTHRALFGSFLYSFGAAFAVAVAFEIMQSVLPVGFARRCDVDDLAPSLIGIVAGCIVGVCLRAGQEKGLSSPLDLRP